MSSFKELLAQREKLDSQINAMMQREKSDGVAKAKAIIEQFGLSVSDLFGRKGATKGKRGRPAKNGTKVASKKRVGKKRGKVAPKYKNPVTGETWTGRGKAPKWIAGKDRSKFAIK
jgi:DNA-binding protein H-NS